MREHGLDQSSDRVIFDFAANDNFTLVAKDKDFRALTVMLGPPPKFIQIMVGNCSVATIARLLREGVTEIRAFDVHPERKLLLLA